MVRAFRWRLGIVLGGLCLLFANIVEANDRAYPYKLRADDGFLYFLVTDSESERIRNKQGEVFYRDPVRSIDGSPLYDGWRASDNTMIRLSYQTLQDEGRLATENQSQPVYQSKWLEGAFSFFVPDQSFKELLEVVHENSEDVFQRSTSMTPRRIEVLRQILYEDRIVLTREDLEDLRRTAFNPSPRPVEFSIDVEAPINLDAYLFEFEVPSWVYNMRVDIEIEQLEFLINERVFEFDPEENRVRVKIVADQAEMEGPLREVGHINYRNPLYEHRHDEQLYLDFGRVQQMEMSFELELAPDPEDGEFWELGVAPLYSDEEDEPSTFKIDFLEENPKVLLRYSGEWSDGTTIDRSGEPELGSARIEVQERLNEMLQDSLRNRFFSKDLGFEWEVKDGLIVEGRINRYQVHGDGVELFFDARVAADQWSGCIPDEVFFESTRNESILEKELGNPWSLRWDPSRKWHLNTDVEESRNSELVVYHDFINAMMKTAWVRGDLCLNSADLEHRPEGFPYVELQPRKLAQWLGSNRVQIPFNFTYFERNDDENHERYEPVWDRQGSLELVFEKEDDPWMLMGPLFFDDEDGSYALINQLVQDWIGDQRDTQKLLNSMSPIEMNSVEFFPDRLRFDFEGEALIRELFREKTDSPEEELKESRSKPELRTVLIDSPPNLVDGAFVRFQWEQEDKREEPLFYSWRFLVYNTEISKFEELNSWALFRSRREIVFHLPAEGLYQFQVKAQDVSYKIEQGPLATHEFYYKEPSTTDFSNTDTDSIDKVKKVESKQDEEQDEKKESQHLSNEKNHRAFGCQLSISQSSSTSILWLLLLFILAVRAFVISNRR